MRVMHVFAKIRRQKGILCFIYLDDILVLNSTPQGVQRNLGIMLQTLQRAGMVVNQKKSILQPSQVVDHLGFTLNLKEGLLEVPKAKVKTVRREMGKLLTHSALSCRKVAAILGNLRSFLAAMPCLRAFTDHMLAFVNRHRTLGWDRKLLLPEDLKLEVQNLEGLTGQWKGRPFSQKVAVRILHSDSSDKAWAGVDVQT